MDISNDLNQEVKILDRNKITITGVKKIISFNKEEFYIESNLGNINVKGNSLELVHLDTQDGTIKIKGKINLFSYLDMSSKSKEESFISKLFK